MTNQICKESIDTYGYAAYLRLVEQRILYDIEKVKMEKNVEETNKKDLSLNKNLLNDIRLKFNKTDKLQEEISGKEKWLKYWMDTNWEVINKTPDYEKVKRLCSNELLELFEKDEDRVLKKYLIIQDAVLAPIYLDLPNFPESRSLKERNTEAGCKLVASNFGMNPQEGVKILKEADKFNKGLQDFWEKIAKYGTFGLLCTGALAAFFAAPIAVFIGGLLGYSGAAAFTAGLAFLGGGSIATGGLGMAGGLAVLVSSGAALGGTSGALIAKKIADIPSPVLAFEMIKNVNYAEFLAQESKRSKKAKTYLDKLLIDFIQIKNSVETELLLNANTSSQIESLIQTYKILEYTMQNLIERVIKKQ